MHKFLLGLWKRLHVSPNIKLFFVRLFTDQFLIGTTGIFFNDRDEVLLVKHSYRDNNHWSLPGGYLKAKEHPRETLEREVFEETGLIVSADAQLKIRTDRDFSRLDITYVGVYLRGDFKPSAEVTEAKFFPLNELPLIPKDQLVFISRAEAIRKKNKNDV